MSIENSALWAQLESLAQTAKGRPLIELFEDEPKRAERFKIEADGLYFDYSKTSINAESRKALLQLAESQDVEGLKHKMFAGEPINTTEDRPL